MWLLVDQIASSPAVTEAISQQSRGFADQVAGEVRLSSQRADAGLERVAQRLLRRNRAQPPPLRGRRVERRRCRPCGGRGARAGRRLGADPPGRGSGSARALRRARDARDRLRARRRSSSTATGALVGIVIGLALSIVDVPDKVRDILLVLGGVAFVVWTFAYFVAFWSGTGQTPGMRVMRIRVRRSPDGRAAAGALGDRATGGAVPRRDPAAARLRSDPAERAAARATGPARPQRGRPRAR